MKQFFWLKNSSDDGHSKLSLQFGIPNSQKIEEQVSVCVCEFVGCCLATKTLNLNNTK